MQGIGFLFTFESSLAFEQDSLFAKLKKLSMTMSDIVLHEMGMRYPFDLSSV